MTLVLQHWRGGSELIWARAAVMFTAPDSSGLWFSSSSLLKTWPLDPCLKALAKIFKKKYMKHYRQHGLSAQSLSHIHILYSASFLSTYLCLNRLRHFTSCLQAANSAIDSWDLCCTKKYIPCTSEISAAIQMYFAQPGGFKVNIQAAPQGFARLMF